MQLTRCRSETNFGDFESIWNGIQQETNATRDMLAEEEAYKHYGVDREMGCVVITRPDQYVGYIGELEGADVDGVEAYFKGVFAEQRDS